MFSDLQGLEQHVPDGQLIRNCLNFPLLANAQGRSCGGSNDRRSYAK